MAHSHWRHALADGDWHRKLMSPGERYSAARCPSALSIDLLKIDDLITPPPINLVSARPGESRPQPANCYVDRLPPELLCAIFLMCGQMDDEFNYPRENMFQFYHRRSRGPQLHHSRAAVSLGLVCARWFTVTRGFPRLWTMVDVGTPKPCDITNLRRCIWYSNGLPLTLRLHDRECLSPTQHKPAVCKAFMQSVASVAFLWEEVSIIHSDAPLRLEDLIEPLLSVSANAYQRLRRAAIYHYLGYTDAPVALRLWELFFASPAIRTAQWFGSRVCTPLHALERLTHIGANDIPPETILDMLRSCPLVEVLQVRPKSLQSAFLGKKDGILIPALSAPISLPRLRQLMLSCMYDFTNLYDGITAPNLDRLDITLAGVQASAIEAMLNRSHTQLSMLAIRCHYSGFAGECAALLRSAPLQHLRILFREVLDNYSDRIVEQFDPVPILPPRAILITNNFELADHTYSSLIQL